MFIYKKLTKYWITAGNTPVEPKNMSTHHLIHAMGHIENACMNVYDVRPTDCNIYNLMAQELKNREGK